MGKNLLIKIKVTPQKIIKLSFGNIMRFLKKGELKTTLDKIKITTTEEELNDIFNAMKGEQGTITLNDFQFFIKFSDRHR